MSGVLKIILGIAAIAILASNFIGEPTTASDGTEPAAVIAAEPKVDKSEEAQKGRADLIQKLIGSGIFEKVEMPGNLPRLWVRQGFHDLEFDAKQKFVSVVYAYYFDGSNLSDSVRIYDNMSGKEIGRFDQSNLTMF